MSSWPVMSTTTIRDRMAPRPGGFLGRSRSALGDIIRVVGEDGKNYEYAVQWTQAYAAAELTPDVIQNDIVGDTGQETLTLITCGGDFDPETGEYIHGGWCART